MELRDYTTEQLKAELKRRTDEERQRKRAMGIRVPNYEYARGKVVSVSNSGAFTSWCWKVEICDEDMKRLGIASVHKRSSYTILIKEFTKATAPQTGDIVLLRKRITKNSPKFVVTSAKICEIVK